MCSHREYCCALGCCVSTAFSLYQLWYFWLLLLLIILLCSGGGWWFRFRHGGFSNESTPTNARGRRHGRRRGQDAGGPRVYPNQHQFYGPGLHHGAYTLPPGYDKDPPSYNEVISHLNEFPRIEDVRRVEGEHPSTSSSTSSTAPVEQVPLTLYDCQSAPPPPSYEMVLDLKRRDVQLTREIHDLEEEEEEEEEESRVRARSAGEEGEDTVSSTRSRIRNLLGRMRPRSSSGSESSQARQEGSGRAASSSPSSPSSSSSGLFTISRESLPQQDYYAQQAAAPSPSEAAVQHQGSLVRRYPADPPSDPDSSSHSDYSSLLVSSLSSSSRSLVTPPSQAPMELLPTSPLEGEIITPEPQEPGHGREQQSGHERPSTCHSVLSRPTTSISTRTLPPPEELIRKTSLPGALLEQEDDRAEVS